MAGRFVNLNRSRDEECRNRCVGQNLGRFAFGRFGLRDGRLFAGSRLRSQSDRKNDKKCANAPEHRDTPSLTISPDIAIGNEIW
jgi:hypothetical protein